MKSIINGIRRCRQCGGILGAEDSFEVTEACACPTPRGRMARSRAALEGLPRAQESIDPRELVSTTWHLYP